MKIIEFNPTYRKDKFDVIYNESVPLPDGNWRIYGSVFFKPGGIGGNHFHPRIEAFYSLGNLTIVWVDKYGKKNKMKMKPESEKYTLFVTEPNEPHAIINKSKNLSFALIEFATEKQYGLTEQMLV